VKGIDIIATGDLIIKPGFGGVYGKISILEHKGLKKIF
jgi:PHP family Zn ribbon phosphoesterase